MAEKGKKRRRTEETAEKAVKRKKAAYNTVIAAGILLVAFCFYQIWAASNAEESGNALYEELREEAVKEPQAEESGEAQGLCSVDFDRLEEINPDVVGWLRFEEPSVIDYPVVQGGDNDRYLGELFDGTENVKGTLFADAENSGDFTDRNTFIYGHNMEDGSMFGELFDYMESSFCEEHPYFYLYTPDGREITYQVFAACVEEDTSDSYDKTYATEEEYLEYLNRIRSRSLYPTDVEVDADSNIVSLSTCLDAYGSERFLVHAVKVGEKRMP